MSIFSSTRSRLAAGLIAAFMLAVVPAVSVLAGFSPDRPTFTWGHPATYITFNSMTDNPQVGDERAFYTVKTSVTGGSVDSLRVQDNQELILQAYFHNNAAANLNLVATNTRVRMILPTTASANVTSNAYIYAENANPNTVVDTVDLSGDRPFTLQYINGSAQIWTNVLRGNQLSDSIVTNDGAQIGYDSINGRVPGCAEFSGFVTIKVRVKMAAAPQPQPEQPKPQQPAPVKPAAAPAPTQLPNTGPASVAGIFAGASAVAGGAHYIITRRRQ